MIRTIVPASFLQIWLPSPTLLWKHYITDRKGQRSTVFFRKNLVLPTWLIFSEFGWLTPEFKIASTVATAQDNFPRPSRTECVCTSKPHSVLCRMYICKPIMGLVFFCGIGSPLSLSSFTFLFCADFDWREMLLFPPTTMGVLFVYRPSRVPSEVSRPFRKNKAER